MNKELTNQIIRHVYHCLGIKLPNKKNKNHPLIQEKYLLDRKISFEDGDKKNIWGVSFQVEDNSYFQIVISDVSDSSAPEYAMICCLTDAPTYGTYLSYAEYLDSQDEECDRPLIAFSVKDSIWSECNTYMQACFLCGMEKIKEITTPFSKITDESIVDNLIKFIEFYQDKMEAEDAGQEI